MRATKQYQKSIQGRYDSEPSLSSRLMQFGGAAALIGGLGFLWYRNSSLKVYREIKDEEFYKLHFKIDNKLFPEIYSISRAEYARSMAYMRKSNPNANVTYFDPAGSSSPKLEEHQSNHLQKNPIPLEGRAEKFGIPKSQFEALLLKRSHYRQNYFPKTR